MSGPKPVPGQVLVYADGSALGNPGPAGWAYMILRADSPPQAEGGNLPHATNNVAELLAATMALGALGPEDIGVLRTDSNYVVKGITQWRRSWERKGMRTATNKPVANADLWRDLFAVVDARPGIRVTWVKGHASDPHNQTVDELARTVATEQRPLRV